MAHPRVIPPETWKPFSRDQVIDVPFFPRDEWGRDVAEALMLGADPDFDLTLVPIELPYRVRYDGATFALMTEAPEPAYWKEP
jgi:hypothetical protein